MTRNTLTTLAALTLLVAATASLGAQDKDDGRLIGAWTRSATLDDDVHVYQDNVRLLVPLTFTNPGGDLFVRGALHYQVCSATECWPPTVWSFELALQETSLVGPT